MALNIPRTGRLKSYFAHLETRDEEVTVYTCPAKCVAYMSLLFLVNNDNSNTSDHSVDLYRAQDDATYHILSAKNLNTSEFLQFSNAYIVLEPGDMVKATVSGNATPHSEVIVTVEEIFIPVGG